jgi:hypothetical protein
MCRFFSPSVTPCCHRGLVDVSDESGARVRRRACHGSASPRLSSRGRGRHGSGHQAAALEPPHGTCFRSIHHIAPFCFVVELALLKFSGRVA